MIYTHFVSSLKVLPCQIDGLSQLVDEQGLQYVFTGMPAMLTKQVPYVSAVVLVAANCRKQALTRNLHADHDKASYL
jgi:hypothetical protein